MPITVLDRFGVDHAGHPSSVHFFRTTDLVAERWPNTPDAQGRKVPLAGFPAPAFLADSLIPDPRYILAQHFLTNMKDVVTLHPSYKDFLEGAKTTVETNTPPITPTASNVANQSAQPVQSGQQQSASTASTRFQTITDLISPKGDAQSSSKPSPDKPSDSGSGHTGSGDQGSPKPSPDKPNDSDSGHTGSGDNGAGNSTEGLTLVRPKGETKVTGVREGDGIDVKTVDKKNDSKPGDQSSNSGKSDNSDSSNKNSSDSNKGSDTSTDNKAHGQGSNDHGGFYTEDQWYAKHEARVEQQWQRAFEKLIRDIPPNVDPRQGQDEEKYLQKLDAAFSAAIRQHVPKPDVDPFPPDFTDSTRPATEAESKFKIPAPNVDPLPPDVQPEKPSPAPKPEPDIASSNLPKASKLAPRPQMAADPPRAPSIQKDTNSKSGPTFSGGGRGAASESDEPMVYCWFDFKKFDRQIDHLTRVGLITQEIVGGDKPETRQNIPAQESFDKIVADILPPSKHIELASSTFSNPPIGMNLLRRTVESRGMQFTVFQAWVNTINAKDGATDSTLKELASESNFFLGLNSFISNENVINLLPDYEALGTTLGLRLNAFNPDSVVFLTPNEIPDTTRIMIAAAKSKIKSAVSQPANSSISQEVNRLGASKKAALVYVRRSGTDRQGTNTSDVDASEAEALLNNSGGDRFLFASLRPDGFLLRGKVDGSIVIAKGGTDKGLAYWTDPVKSVLKQFFRDSQNVKVVVIKNLDPQRNSVLSELLGAKQKNPRLQSQTNTCFFHSID